VSLTCTFRNFIEQKDKQNIIYYHTLPSIAGIGGNIKYFYAAQLSNRLAKYLGIEQQSVMVAEEEGVILY